MPPDYRSGEQVEQTLFEGFPSAADNALMSRFHKLPWDARYTLCDRFEKQALGFLAKRLIYVHNQEFLPSAWRNEIEMHIESRITHASPDMNWNTLGKARADCLSMLESAAPGDVALLTGYLNYLNERISNNCC
jgi:hypothetical protein